MIHKQLSIGCLITSPRTKHNEASRLARVCQAMDRKWPQGEIPPFTPLSLLLPPNEEGCMRSVGRDAARSLTVAGTSHTISLNETADPWRSLRDSIIGESVAQVARQRMRCNSVAPWGMVRHRNGGGTIDFIALVAGHAGEFHSRDGESPVTTIGWRQLIRARYQSAGASRTVEGRAHFGPVRARPLFQNIRELLHDNHASLTAKRAR